MVDLLLSLLTNGDFSLKAPLKTLLPKQASYREALISALLNISPRFIQRFGFGFWRQKNIFKITAAAFLSLFLLGYQPTFAFPPVSRSVVKAQGDQSQAVGVEVTPQFQVPFAGYISNPFSWYHPAIDIATGFGTPIHPVAKGVVEAVNFGFVGYGNHVIISHEGGFKSLYAHLDKIFVQKDQQISDGDEIGTVGLTGFTSGPHTHLEISKDGKNINPVDVLPPIGNTPSEQFITPYQAPITDNQNITPSSQPASTPSPVQIVPQVIIPAPVEPVVIPTPAPVQEKLAKSLKLDL